MNRLAFAFLVAIVPAVRADDAADIRKVLDEQVVAWNKGDLAGFMTGQTLVVDGGQRAAFPHVRGTGVMR